MNTGSSREAGDLIFGLFSVALFLLAGLVRDDLFVSVLFPEIV